MGNICPVCGHLDIGEKMISMAVGLFVGVFIGVLIMAMCVAGKS